MNKSKNKKSALLTVIKKSGVPHGLVIVYTGDGKGKTTAAIGMAVRAAGWGEKVAIIQFIKGYKETGEWKFLKNTQNIRIYQTHEAQSPMIGKPTAMHKEGCQKALRLVRKLICQNKYDLFILDEINNAIFYDLVEAGEIIKIIEERPVKQTIVLTGRNAPPELINIANLVTEMKKVKHPFDQGSLAQKGIDF